MARDDDAPDSSAPSQSDDAPDSPTDESPEAGITDDSASGGSLVDSVDAQTGGSGEAVIQGDNVTREYRSGEETVRALDGIDFRIEPGEFVAVVGPSGSGKSTLLNILGLLDAPTSGTVTLQGQDVATFSARDRTRERKRVIGFVFQSFYLIPTLTALENVEMPRMLDRTPTKTRERARRLLERVGLGDRLDHNPDQLSGGQKQRVAIARSLINSPQLLLADEPTGNLDRDTGDQILALFDELRREENVAVVTVTHDEYVAKSADRVVNLIDGVVRDG